MASEHPDRCCVEGFKHEGTPIGRKFKIGVHNAYIAAAKTEVEKKGCGILYSPDVIGIWQNSMLLADQFASEGFTTVIIEPFYGDQIEINDYANTDLKSWLFKGRNGAGPHTPEHIDPIIKEVLAYMKTDLGLQKIGAVGYCFGGKYVVRHYQSGIKVGYMAHPSFVDEDELAAISGPLSISAAETDAIFTNELRHKSEEILKRNGNVYQINVFSGVAHGFAVRCNLEEKRQRVAKEMAFKQAINFFQYWLV